MWPNAGKIVVLKDPSGTGQAAGCPIGEPGKSHTLLILTAAHVAKHSPLDIFNVDGVKIGSAKTLRTIKGRDLAFMVANVGLPQVPVAPEAPSIGDGVFIYGPIPMQENDGFVDGFWKGNIVGMHEGLMAAWSGNGPGSSGSCVLNEKGETVAINVANFWWGQGSYVKQVSLSEPIWGLLEGLE